MKTSIKIMIAAAIFMSGTMAWACDKKLNAAKSSSLTDVTVAKADAVQTVNIVGGSNAKLTSGVSK